MRIEITKYDQSNFRTDILIYPISKGELGKKSRKSTQKGALSLNLLERLLGTDYRAALKKESFEAAELKGCVFRTPESKHCRAVIFIGIAGEKEFASKSALEQGEHYRKLGAKIVSYATATASTKVTLSSSNLNLGDDSCLKAVIEGVHLAGYSFDRYQKKKKVSAPSIQSLTLMTHRSVSRKQVREASATARATLLARDLINMPACDCTPAYLVKTARGIGRKAKIQVQVFDKARLAKMKAGALLSVAQGSQTPPYLIKMTYKPTGRTKRKVISLVGKGVTFDSGGLSIKSGAGMMDMKCDMSGAATVIAAMQAIAAVKPSCEVRAYIPATENMINGRATRPGDVVKASNGKSIEILNTDAEGRLILADALCLAEKDGCDQIIDLATLTGACLVALGKDYAGLYSTSEKMVKGLSEAAAHAGERVWHMPLADEYRSLIKSSVADIKNIGGPHGGSITAALFLQEFVENTDWAHLDIAGPAFTASASDYISKGGVGFGVGTLVRYVQSI